MEFGQTKLYLIVCIVLMPHVWPRTRIWPRSCLVTRYTPDTGRGNGSNEQFTLYGENLTKKVRKLFFQDSSVGKRGWVIVESSGRGRGSLTATVDFLASTAASLPPLRLLGPGSERDLHQIERIVHRERHE